MTHSGGKPHAVGDRGQRYEVTYFDGEQRCVFGWSETITGAYAMKRCIEKHPSWTNPLVKDRKNERDS